MSEVSEYGGMSRAEGGVAGSGLGPLLGWRFGAGVSEYSGRGFGGVKGSAGLVEGRGEGGSMGHSLGLLGAGGRRIWA